VVTPKNCGKLWTEPPLAYNIVGKRKHKNGNLYLKIDRILIYII
jgi:hypothetical protein